MSQNSLHIESWSEFGKHIKKILAFESAQTRLAIKVGSATCFAVFIALFFNIQDPYWAGISAFLVSAEQVGNSFSKTIIRIVCTLMGVIGGALCVHFFMEEPVLLLIVTFTILTYTIYRGFRDDEFYLWIFSSITFFMVVAEYIATGNTMDTLNLALYRGWDITIGSIVGFIASLLIFPTHASTQFENKLNQFLQELSIYYAQTINTLYVQNNEGMAELRKNIVAHYKGICQLSALAQKESLLFERTRYRVADRLEKLTIALKELQNFEQMQHVPESLYFKQCKDKILHLQRIFQAFIIEPTKQEEHARQALADLYHAYDTLRRTGQTFQYALQEITVFHTFLSMHQTLLDLFTNTSNDNKKVFHPKIKHPLNYLRENYLYWMFGAKVALGMIALPLIWVALAIPGGSQLGVSMGAILNLDFNASKKKGWMRFYGCLVGAACALFAIIILQVESFTLLLILIFITAFVFGYIHNSGSNISYLGTQALVAFLMGTVVDSAPTLIPDPAVERLIGITFGVAFLFIILEWVWPFKPKERVHHYTKQIDAALVRLRFILEAYLNKADFNFLKSIEFDINMIKRNQSQFASYSLTDPKLIAIRNQYLQKAKKIDALEAFLIFLSEHATAFQKYEGEILATIDAFVINTDEALKKQQHVLENLLQKVREQAQQGNFPPVLETILLASFVRKGVLLLQSFP